MNKESSLNNTYNNTYTNINNTINIFELKEKNKKEINDETIKELMNTQRIKSTETNSNKNNEIKKYLDYEIALEKFNKKYEYGLSYLKTLGYINISSSEEEAKSINEFLKETKDINKINLFEFLGDNTQLSSKVLEKFLDNFNFNNIDIIQSIKKFFFMNFYPFNKREKFEKILYYFSRKYCKDNIIQFYEKEENIYYLSYAIIILLNNKENIEKNEFIEKLNNLMKNNKKNIFQIQFLENIYYQVKQQFNFSINSFFSIFSLLFSNIIIA